MFINLRDKQLVEIRFLETNDELSLFQYFENFSSETKSRYGPHSFDHQTVHEICLNPSEGIKRYIAIDPANNIIIAYMLVKDGLIESDEQRFAERDIHFDSETACTFAPSIADNWQSAGLGTAMFDIIETDLKLLGKRIIILWAGVQASNKKAVLYYRKIGFVEVGTFIFNNIDNYDMIKEI